MEKEFMSSREKSIVPKAIFMITGSVSALVRNAQARKKTHGNTNEETSQRIAGNMSTTLPGNSEENTGKLQGGIIAVILLGCVVLLILLGLFIIMRLLRSLKASPSEGNCDNMDESVDSLEFLDRKYVKQKPTVKDVTNATETSGPPKCAIMESTI